MSKAVNKVKIDLGIVNDLAKELSTLPREHEVIENISVELLRPGQYQPRKEFDQDKLKDLADSIKEKGVIIPIIIRRIDDDSYEIVAGERRWRASMMAGLKTIPCIRRNVSDSDALAVALIENIDREGMSAIDIINGVSDMVERLGSIREAAKILGKDEPWVSKRNRIANAPEDILNFIKIGYSNDIEGFYELVRLAEKNLASAREIMTEWELDPLKRTSLRAAVLDVKNTFIEPGNSSTGIARGSNRRALNRPQNISRPEPKEILPIMIYKGELAEKKLTLSTNEGEYTFEFFSDASRTEFIDSLRGKI